ncbi:PrsW family intramembrane metalloprotease [Pendulispora albinea]|uniref:PrsW family intramembrane metalloprotease n=1 Tax=Pendulispora albinea TaxID=2741071 RepID=A0ABZ2LJ09_9BACT
MSHAPYRFLLALMCFFLGTGCAEVRLAQTNDVDLVYAMAAAAPATPVPSGSLEAQVRARLAAARIAADVRVADGALHVTVDLDNAAAVDPLLLWRGGIALHRWDGHLKAGDDEPRETPLVDFAGRVARVETARHGHDLTLFTTVAMRNPPKEPLTVSLAGKVVAVQKVDHTPSLTVSFGDDLDSYGRADRAKRLLETPALPALTKAAREPVPPRWGIGVLGLLLPIALSMGWLSFVRRFDRARPEPRWLVGTTFALGGASAMLAGLVEYGLGCLSPYLHPIRMTLGGQLLATPLALVVFTAVVGLPEEGSKWLGTWALARHRPEFDEPVDGIVYGVASSLGFAAMENIRYFAWGRLATSVVVLRAFTSVPAHMFFGAIWGYALGRKLVAPQTSVPKFLLAAAILHGAYDTFLSVHALEPLTLVLHVALTSLFIVLLRRALRRGVVTAGDAVPESSRRLSIGLGSPFVFALWAVSIHLIAAAIVTLALYFDATHERINATFLVAGSGLLLLFGVAAHGLVGSLPLEAVIDENGVTFAGATRAWSDIGSFERKRASRIFGEAYELVIQSRAGTLHIGPGSDEATTTLAACLAAYTARA